MSWYRTEKRIFTVLITGVFSLSLSIALCSAANAFSQMVVFGDSLSDSGNVYIASANQIPAPPYYNGRFSNGPNYADHLASNLALELEPFLQGGTNFAVGGATTEGFPEGLPYGLLAQIDEFNFEVAIGVIDRPDKDALYIVFIGGNDLLEIMRNALADPANQSTIIANGIAEIINNIHTALERLKDAEAVNILVPNLPNVGRTPDMVQRGAASLGAEVTTAFNAQLDSMLDSVTGVNIIRFDTYSRLEILADDPQAYGFTNVDSACYTGDYTGGGSVCADPNSYLFWDDIHPSAQTHLMLSKQMLTALLDNAWRNAGALDLGNGWRWVDWLGYFYINDAPWIYHAQLRWLHQYGTGPDNLVFYNAQMGAFWWTGQQVFPFLYRFSDQTWLWYLMGSQDPSWFYNYRTSQWESY